MVSAIIVIISDKYKKCCAASLFADCLLINSHDNNCVFRKKKGLPDQKRTRSIYDYEYGRG